MAAPSVPVTHPVVPVVPGDGPIADWDAVQARVDAAVKEAYAGARAIDWLTLPAGRDALADGPLLVPDATAAAIREYGIALVGPLDASDGRSEGALAALHRTLDLVVDHVELLLGGRVVPVWIAGIEGDANPVDLPAGDERTEAVLKQLAKAAPSTHARLRFGSRERIQAYDRARGVRGAAELQTAIGVTGLSGLGFTRFVAEATRHVGRSGRKLFTLVHGGDASRVELAARDLFYDELEGRWGPVVLTERNYGRVAIAEGDFAAADAYKKEFLADGSAFADDLTLDAALECLVRDPARFDAVLATPDAGWTFVHAARTREGDTNPLTVTASSTTGLRVVTSAPGSPGGEAALRRSARKLLELLDFSDAAGLV